jgi:hypothetical protein
MPSFLTDPTGFFNSPEVVRSMVIWLPSLIIWTVFWKGYALWRAARNSQKVWFVILLFLNTLGIFEILYLALFQRNKNARPAVITKKTLIAKKH